MNYKKYLKKKKMMKLRVVLLDLFLIASAVLYGFQTSDHIWRTKLCPEFLRLIFVDRLYLRALMNIYTGNTVLGECFYLIAILVGAMLLLAVILRIFRKKAGKSGWYIASFIYAVDILYSLIAKSWFSALAHAVFIAAFILESKAQDASDSFENSVWGSIR